MKCCGTQYGCRSRFSATNAPFVNARKAERPNFVGLLTHAFGRGPGLPRLFWPSRKNPSSDRLSPKKQAQHLQRRYRSGIEPDYLVQQIWPYAISATKLVFCCRKYCNTPPRRCQQQMKPRQQNHWANTHRHICHQLPPIWKPRKLPACRR